MIIEGELLWSPTSESVGKTNLARYTEWLRREHNHDFSSYEELRQWSVDDIEAFWASIWTYFKVQSSTPYQRVLSDDRMPGARWFEGAKLNYAEHMLRSEPSVSADKVVFYHQSEVRPLSTTTWHDLASQVRILATQMRAMGIEPGDRVVSYMPNILETAVAFLATTAIGAIWSSAAPEFGIKTVVDRFSQIEPKLLFAADGYRFGGKDFDREQEVRSIVGALPSLTNIIWVSHLRQDATTLDLERSVAWREVMDHAPVAREDFRYEQVEHDHPLWILFSSGTTGLPKAIVHSHTGALLEHLKVMHFHINLRPDSVMFFYSTTGWMMWNILLAALLAGSSAVLYDGNPVYPGHHFLWELASRTGVTSFGASPTFVQMMEKVDLRPAELFDLSSLESVVVSGAPSTAETFEWFYRCVKRDLLVTSQSGGTELCSGLVGGSPMVPVYAGEIQCRMLGMDVHAWNDRGEDVIDEVGELVVTKPFPSMPIRFWNDDGGKRYHESYFDVFPGVWRHGDFIKINQRGGAYIYGRSDATLNRHGVRIGTAEIYRTVEQVAEVADSLIVCCETGDGGFFMPLFLRLKTGVRLDEALVKKIAKRLREDCSPRHVPDQMYQIQEVPYTLTGKKMEVPVRKLLMGWDVEKAASRDAMTNPASLDYFIRFAAESKICRRRLTASGPVE